MLELQENTYQCPGESYGITHSVHLGRMAAFDARCRGCQHRHDVGSLPVAIVKQLEASWQQDNPALFDEQGATGLAGETMDAATVRRLASSFGTLLIDRAAGDPPQVIVAGDGRSVTAELVAAASEGLRWSGCEVIETPSATSASMLFTQSHYRAAGGLLVGNAAGTPRTASLRFFGPGGRPVLEPVHEDDLSLLQVRRRFECGLNRPGRRYGAWRRGSAEREYLASLAGHFHALRPLRFMLDTCSAPAARYLNQLLTQVGCRWFSPKQAAELPAGSLHFRFWIDGDGERCRVSDECGRAIEQHAALRLLANALSSRSLSEANSPDALHALALLLSILSQSDRPLSAVVSTSASGCSSISRCP